MQQQQGSAVGQKDCALEISYGSLGRAWQHINLTLQGKNLTMKGAPGNFAASAVQFQMGCRAAPGNALI